MIVELFQPRVSLKPFLIAAFASAALGGIPQASAYTAQSINTPGAAVRMSGNGSVVGNYVSSCSNINTQFDHAKYCFISPWFFDGKNVTKLVNALPSGTNSYGAAINDTRQVVGSGGSSTGGGSWLYSAGAVTYTGTLTGSPCNGVTLSAINNPGVAVGSTCFGRAVSFQNGSLALVNFIEPPPQYLSLPTTQAIATDINDRGLITGWYKAADGTEYGFVVDPNATGTTNFAIIPNLSGAASCRPVRISQANATTGQIWVGGNCSGRPYIYNLTTSSLTELTSAGSTSLTLTSVNSQGVALGNGYSVLLWPAGSTSSTVPIDLNANQAFAPVGAWNLRASDINDAGTVLAGYNDSKGNFYTFLLRP